jgi:hypothetical protein
MPRRPLPEFQDGFLDEDETSEVLEISVPALQADRWKGTLGIPYYKFGTRVRYLLSEILAWAAAHRIEPPVASRAAIATDDADSDDVRTRRPVRRGRARRKPGAGVLEPVLERT